MVRERGIEPLRRALPVDVTFVEIVLFVVAGCEGPAHDHVNEEKHAIDGQCCEHGRPQLEAEPGNEPGARCQRQQGDGEDDERVAEAGVQRF